MGSVDDQGLDTELARILHRGERVDLPTLQSILGQARLARSRGPTLARMLVGRGLISEAEAASLVAGLAEGRLSSSLTDSHEVPRSAPMASPPPVASLAGSPARGTGRMSSSAELVRPTAGDIASADVWRVGGLIDRYRIIDRVGAGGMGVVYVAEHTGTGVRYALKTLRAGADDDEKERFRREGESQARVDGHPNVIRVHSMGEISGRQFLVMDLAAGGDLEQRVKRGELPLAAVAGMLAQVARGLAHMHERGVLHRDLKPANVLFDAPAPGGIPKLVDFGLARVEGASRLTRTGDVVGTPAYMAPEQALGQRDELGPWTDVFALGGVLYYALTGQVPFQGATSIEVMTKVVDDEPTPPHVVRPEVPLELEAICLRALTKERERRPSAAELADALEAIAACAQAATAAPPPPPPSSRLIPALAALAALSVLGLGLAVVLRGRRDTPPDAPPRTATPIAAEPPSPPPPPLIPAAPPPSPPAPREPARPTAWAFRAGAPLRVELTIEGEMRAEMLRLWTGNPLLESVRRFVFVWTPRAVGAERVTIGARLEEMTFRIKSGDISLDYDSRRQRQDYALGLVVGGTFELVLDPRTGAVESVSGVEDLQEKIDGACTQDERRLRQVTELTSSSAMRDALSNLTSVLPVEPLKEDTSGWSLKRDAVPAMPGLSAFGLACHAEGRRERDRGFVITWTGDKAGEMQGFDRRGRVPTTRTVEGEATLRDGALTASRVIETFQGGFTSRSTSALTVLE